MVTQGTRQTEAVLKHHLESVLAKNVDAVMQD